MGIDQQPGDRFLRLDRGSAVIEGAAALGVAFFLLALVVQVAFLLSARASAQAAVDSFVRRAAVTESDSSSELVAELGRALPGASDISVTVSRSPSVVTAALEFTWNPPGPRLIPVVVRVIRSSPAIEPP